MYVDYLEVAPWNRTILADRPARYAGCGSAMLAAAVVASREEEFRGRIGLHSLPQSEDFYRRIVGMTSLGSDASKGGLTYFEMDPTAADRFFDGSVR